MRSIMFGCFEFAEASIGEVSQKLSQNPSQIVRIPVESGHVWKVERHS
jgi:hypothetical protein